MLIFFFKRKFIIMKLEKILLLTVTTGIVVYWLNENNKSKKEIQNLQFQNRNLANTVVRERQKFSQFQQELFEQINQRDELTEEIKKQLKDLIEKYKFIDEDVTNELISVASLIDMKQDTKAIASLTKVIENLLKKVYATDSNLRRKLPKNQDSPRLVDYLRHAKDENLIEEEEFEFASGLRKIRNQEAHELNINKGRNWVASAFLTGISIILKIHDYSINIE